MLYLPYETTAGAGQVRGGNAITGLAFPYVDLEVVLGLDLMNIIDRS